MINVSLLIIYLQLMRRISRRHWDIQNPPFVTEEGDSDQHKYISL